MATQSGSMQAISNNEGHPRNIKAAASTAAGDYDDDTISLTSTATDGDNPDAKYAVETILQEMEDNDGTSLYLVKWQNYPLEKCTWESKDNLGDKLLDEMWEKRQPDLPRFNMSLFSEAMEQEKERHRRRNAKRKRLGLPLTEPFDDEPSERARDSTRPPKASENDNGRTEYIDLQDGVPSEDCIYVKETPLSPAAKKTEADRGGMTTSDISSFAPTKKKTQSVLFPSERPEYLKGKKIEKRGKTPPSSSGSKAAAKALEGAGHPMRQSETTGSIRKRQVATSTGSNLTPRAATNTVKSDSSTRPFLARNSGLGSQEPVANAFAGGKKIRTGTLEETISDSNRGKICFKAHRRQRLALPRGRERQDRAIDLKKLPARLFPISQGGPSRDGAICTPTEQTIPSNTPTPRSVNDTMERCGLASLNKPRKQKTVQFLVGGDDDESGPLPAGPCEDIDVQNAHIKRTQPAKQTTQRTELKTVAKMLVFGARNEPIAATFGGVPSDVSSPVLEAFLSEETLKFDHICLAESLVAQIGFIRCAVLSNGNIVTATDTTDTASLDTVAARLRAMSSGLFLARSTYGIVLYPAQCDAWKEKLFGFHPPDETSTSTLRYIVFSTWTDFSVFLRPLENVSLEIDVLEGVSERRHLMQTYFHLDGESYLPLFPESARQSDSRRNILLVSPPSLEETMSQLALWLRDIDPPCGIFFSSNPGAWLAFHNKVLAKSEAGIVIVHELASWSVRHFPNILRLTDNENCKFWSLSQSILSPQMYPSLDIELGIDIPADDPGEIRWTQLFPNGIAILVTPSFLVSEPVRAYELFDWFIRARRSSSVLPIKLVTGWDIRGYLKVLADEKYQQRDELQKDPRLTKEIDREIITANLKGIRMSQCEYRYKTWLLVTENFSFHELEEPMSVHGESNPIIYAPEVIDSSDEQSLVNWFGWWSVLRLDQFQSFHVIGSSIATKRKGSERAKRHIRIPNFSPDTVADSYVTGERMKTDTSGEDCAAAGTMTETTPAAASIAQKRTSRRFPDDSLDCLRQYLMAYSDGKPTFWKCYGIPIFWTDIEEPYQMGEINPKNSTINDWFRFQRPFKTGMDGVALRSHIALFYTVDEAWDRTKAQRGEKAPRHPWVVVYRPVNAQGPLPLENTELLIWDVRFKGGKALPREKDLTARQQAMIKHVRTHGKEKNPLLDLAKIWISSEPLLEGAVPQKRSTNELDMTMDYLDSVTSDFNAAMPTAAKSITERGFVRVRGNDEEDESDDDRGDGSPMDLDSEGTSEIGGLDGADECEADPVKMVFHAPRRASPVPGQPCHATKSKCRNHLYESTRLGRLAQLSGGREKLMAYEYRPTLDWYLEQAAEGRGYEHVHVHSWEAFFKKFNIGSEQLRTE